MRCRSITIVFLSMLVALLLPVVVNAADTKNQGHGLFISPLRQQMNLNPGRPVPVTVTIGNLTSEPMDVDLHVKQFSVTDYTYDYQFRPLEYDWVKLPYASVALQPGQKKPVRLMVTAPASAATGGYYFAVFASTRVVDTSVKSTVQAASLLYTMVDGGDVKRSTTIHNDRIPSFVMSGEIPFRFNIKNTGNVHIAGNFFARLEGITGKSADVGVNHILLPDTTRTISGVVLAPVLPGIYKVVYGYKVDSSDEIVTKSAYVFFIPPWSLVAVLLIVLLGSHWLRRRQHQTSDN